MSVKKKTCPLSSNFAFAVVALLTAGLLLYTTVEVFNCKQDIAQINERIQNSPKFVSTHNEQKIEKQGRDENNEISKNNSKEVGQKDVDGSVENVNNFKEIVYDKDGSIDTNNWKIYKNDLLGIEFKYPEERIISSYDFGKNVVYLDERKERTHNVPVGIVIELHDSFTDITDLKVDSIKELIELDDNVSFDRYWKLNGKKAIGVIKKEYFEGDLLPFYTIFYEKDSKIYKIFFYSYNKYSQITNIDKEILKSFKFL